MGLRKVGLDLKNLQDLSSKYFNLIKNLNFNINLFYLLIIKQINVF